MVGVWFESMIRSLSWLLVLNLAILPPRDIGDVQSHFVMSPFGVGVRATPGI